MSPCAAYIYTLNGRAKHDNEHLSQYNVLLYGCSHLSARSCLYKFIACLVKPPIADITRGNARLLSLPLAEHLSRLVLQFEGANGLNTMNVLSHHPPQKLLAAMSNLRCISTPSRHGLSYTLGHHGLYGRVNRDCMSTLNST